MRPCRQQGPGKSPAENTPLDRLVTGQTSQTFSACCTQYSEYNIQKRPSLETLPEAQRTHGLTPKLEAPYS